MNGRAWTKQDLAMLEAIYPINGAAFVAATLGRTLGATKRRAQAIGFGTKRRWTEIEDQRLRRLLAESGIRRTARLLSRTKRSVYSRAKALGLELGCPRGYEYIATAAERAGYAPQTLWKILRWAGVRTQLSLADPSIRRKTKKGRFYIVDEFDVDNAVSKWLATETPTMAARRLGCDYRRVVSALLASGLPLPARPPGHQHWRIPSVIVEEALAMHGKVPDLGSTAQGAAGVFPGANARRDATAMSIRSRRTPSGIDHHRAVRQRHAWAHVDPETEAVG